MVAWSDDFSGPDSDALGLTPTGLRWVDRAAGWAKRSGLAVATTAAAFSVVDAGLNGQDGVLVAAVAGQEPGGQALAFREGPAGHFMVEIERYDHTYENGVESVVVGSQQVVVGYQDSYAGQRNVYVIRYPDGEIRYQYGNLDFNAPPLNDGKTGAQVINSYSEAYYTTQPVYEWRNIYENRTVYATRSQWRVLLRLWTPSGTTTAFTHDAGQTVPRSLEVRLDGTRIETLVNGASVNVRTDSFNANSTVHGIRTGGSTGARAFDAVSFTPRIGGTYLPSMIV